MQLKLAENIKKHRKEMGLTQEGLADAIGVTVGAVSKWEKGFNVPDILTMMELANFFNQSLDELVGYDMSSKKVEDMCERIDYLSCEHCFDEAIKAANDALSRYPHMFTILYTCAEMYNRKHMESGAPEDAEKAINMYETALIHIVQNKNHEISEYSIKARIANLYRKSDPEKALELLKEINYDGCYSNAIAMVLLEMGKVSEALDNLTIAILQNYADQNAIAFNTAWALSETGKKSDLKTAIELLNANITVIDEYSYKDKVSYSYKIKIIPMITKACMYAILGENEEMKSVIRETRKLSQAFDEAGAERSIPDFFKFCFTTKDLPVYDSTGTSAAQSIEALLLKKLAESKGKQKKGIQKVLDCWKENKV